MEDTELLDKRGYLTIVLNTVREGKILLRKTEGLREWFNSLKVQFVQFDLGPHHIILVCLTAVAE